jgi:predicted DNA-binding antitoxin AbrB/MazE fold protein
MELRLWGYSFGDNCLNNCSILVEAGVMTITVEATYEKGVLKLAQPLPLKEHQRVQVTIQPPALDIVQAYGIMGWKGTHEELEQLLAEADLDWSDAPASGGRVYNTQG